MIRGLFFASFVSIMIAMIISFLPTVDMNSQIKDSNENRMDQTVFRTTKPIHLDKEYIVPFFKELPVFYSYKKVEIDGHELFVESKVLKQELNKVRIFHDAYQLIKVTFNQTRNIDQLYVRFVLLGEDQTDLLLSVTTERSDILMKMLSNDVEQGEIESFLKNNTKLFYGTGWSN
jgi:hypothetical protein